VVADTGLSAPVFSTPENVEQLAMTLKPLEQMINDVEGSGIRHQFAQKNYPTITEQESRCAQDLLMITTYMRRITSHNREGSGFPITMQQYSVLKALKEQTHLISELADIFKVSRPTMSRIIDSLEGRRRNPSNESESERKGNRRAKLVERVDSLDDRRLVYARITQEGLDMLDYYCDKSEENVAAVLRRVPLENLNQLEQVLATLRMTLETHS